MKPETRKDTIIILLLITAAFIYYMFRPASTIFNLLLDNVGLPSPVLLSPSGRYPFWIYNFPELLWIMAFSLALLGVRFRTSWLERLKLVIAGGLFILLEFLQLWGITKGTFDIKDIFALLLGIFIAYKVNHMIYAQQQYFGWNYNTVRLVIVYLTLFFAHQV